MIQGEVARRVGGDKDKEFHIDNTVNSTAKFHRKPHLASNADVVYRKISFEPNDNNL